MDSLVSSLLSKYLTVFIKNFSSKNLNLSFWSGEGNLNNLEINEDVVQEFMPSFLQVNRVFVNSLAIKLPFVTNLGYEPIEIIMDQVICKIGEPINPRPIKTPLKDFLKTLKKPVQQGSTNSLYGFTDRIIDGITFKMNYLEVQISTLGQFPSKIYGEWTPPYIVLSCKNFNFKTCDKDWKIVPLKNSLNMNPKINEDIFIFKFADMKSVNIELKHPSNDDSYEYRNFSAYKPNNMKLIENLLMQIRITQRKSCYGKSISNHIEILFDKLHIKLDQSKLKTIFQTLLGLFSSTQRKDLIQRKQLHSTKDPIESKMNMTSLSTSSKSRSKTDAFTKFINKKEVEEEIEEDSDKEEDEIDDEFYQIKKEEEEKTTRLVFRICLNELYIELFNNSKTDIEIYLFEILGFEFSFIKPEDSIIDKFIQISIPFISFSHLHSKFENEKFKNEETSFIYSNSKEYEKDLKDDFTIPIFIWPEFVSTHRFYPEKKSLEYSNKPRDINRRIHFQEGKEIVRIKITLSDDIEIESRINPIQFALHTKKIIKLIEYFMESIPDTSLKPLKEHIIPLPKYVKQKIKKEEEEEEKLFKLIVEIRSPSILFPSSLSSDEISEYIKFSMKELIISSDSRIKRQNWTEEDSLYSQKGNDFPTKNTDYTNQHIIWELLPIKLKIQLSKFIIQLLPSITSPPQTIMEPLNLNFDLGINDESLSIHHSSLPKFVLMSNLGKIHLHLNQNQAIMFLQIIKSYIDNPPEISFFLIKKTTKIASTTINNEKEKIKNQQLNYEEMIEEKNLISLLILFKLDELLFSLNNSSNNMKDMFDSNFIPIESKICELSLKNSEILIETHNQDKNLIIKSRIGSLELLSPPSKDPSSIIISSSSYLSDYVFNLEKLIYKYIIILRYDHSLKNKFYENLNEKILPNLNIDIKGIHLGLNAKSLFQTLKFYYSRENIFDCSPMEIMNRAVKTTVSLLKEKYSNSKKEMEKQEEKKKEEEKKEEKKMIIIEDYIKEEEEEIKEKKEEIEKEYPDVMQGSLEDLINENDLKEFNESLKKEEGDEVKIEFSPIEDMKQEQKNEQEEEEKIQGAKKDDDILLKIKNHTEKFENYYNQKRKDISPIIFNITIKDIELYILGEGEFPSGIGIELKNVLIKHYQIDEKFQLEFKGEGATLNSLIYTESKVKHFNLCEPIVVEGNILSDYVKSIYEKSFSLNIIPTNIKLSSDLTYILSKLLKQQFFDLRELIGIIKFLKQPSKAFASSFNLLNEKIQDSQKSIIRAQSSHFALYHIFDDIHKELEDKTIAIQTAIEDKLKLMERLSNPTSNNTTVIKEVVPNVSNILLEEDIKITLQGEIKTLTSNAKEWTKCYCYIIDKKIICLNSKMKPTQSNIVKYKFYSLQISEKTECYQSLAPVDNDFTPVAVLMIINNEKEKMFICPEERNKTEEWFKVINNLTKKEPEKDNDIKTMVSTEVQTEYLSYLNDEKYSSTLKEIKNMTKQFELMKSAMHIAKEEGEVLSIRMTDLNQYVTQLKEEEANRLKSTQEKLKIEAERSLEFEKYKDLNEELLFQNQRKDEKIKLLEDQLSKLKEKHESSLEENSLLNNELKYLINHLEDKNTDLEEKNKKLVKQITGDNTKTGQIEVDMAISNMKMIISDLYQTIATKDEEIKKLKSFHSTDKKTLPPIPSKRTLTLPPTPKKDTNQPHSLTPTPTQPTNQRSGSVLIQDFFKVGKEFLDKLNVEKK